MDEMKIVSKFTRGIISKALKMVIHKKPDTILIFS
jgi:hypothetical protein